MSRVGEELERQIEKLANATRKDAEEIREEFLSCEKSWHEFIAEKVKK